MSILVNDLYFQYSGGADIDIPRLELPGGAFTAVCGKNGSGKSTLVRLLAGMMKPVRGSIEIDGREFTGMRAAERARLTGYLPQHHAPVFPFSVFEVVLTGRAAQVFSIPGRHDRVKAGEALHAVGISHLHERPYTELSGGEQQLVMIARMLAQEARILLLDEPASHLDLPNSERLFTLLRGLVADGYTVIAVIHDLNAAFRAAGHAVFLKGGRLLYSGSNPDDPALLTEAYDTRIGIMSHGNRRLVFPE
jgi:iron complex transport system ATP-binding protein